MGTKYQPPCSLIVQYSRQDIWRVTKNVLFLLLFVVDFSFSGSLVSVMDTEAILFTLAYVLVSACIVCPPTEFINAGLTVQNVLAPVLGSEQLDFVHFHIRRTTSTLFIHALLPLGKCI